MIIVMMMVVDDWWEEVMERWMVRGYVVTAYRNPPLEIPLMSIDINAL